MRSGRRALLLAAAGWLASVGAAAAAATLSTPPLEKDDLSEFRCFVLNTGTRPTGPITIEIRTFMGAVLETQSLPALAPGDMAVLAYLETLQPFAYCVVDGKFSSRRIRVSLCTLPGDGDFDCRGTVSAP